MKLHITSASGNILTLDSFLSASCMTEAGQITILPGHEPLLSALRPGIMRVDFMEGEFKKTIEYVSSGGVINTTPEIVTIIADIIEAGEDLKDLFYIAAQKKEAEELMEAYKAENGPDVDPRRLIAIEHDLLKYTAMHELGKKYHAPMDGSRR